MTVETPITANGTRKDGLSNAGVYSLKIEKAIGGAGSTQLVTWKQDTMETPDYLQEKTKFAQRELPAAEFEGSSQEFEVNRSAKEAAARRLTAVARMDRFEESAYWLLSAATLVYLLLGIISW